MTSISRLHQWHLKDPQRVIIADEKHSRNEGRLFCLGVIGNRVSTVRFTMRGGTIRLIGAGFWRKGKEIYEKENQA